MHLLALADTVSTCDADFAERFATNARADVAQATSQEILPGNLLLSLSLRVWQQLEKLHPISFVSLKIILNKPIVMKCHMISCCCNWNNLSRFSRRLRPAFPPSNETLRLPPPMLTVGPKGGLTEVRSRHLQSGVGLPFGNPRPTAAVGTGLR